MKKSVMIGIALLLIVGIGMGYNLMTRDVEEDVNTDVENSFDPELEAGPSDVMTNPVVTIAFEDGNEVVVELYPEVAPNTVNNFVALAQDGFYDGLTFHRIIKDFMVQGGDPEGTGMGGPGYTIDGEFTGNGFENNLSHTAGVVSMARTNQPNTAGSQFFIVHGDASFLDGQYAAFGKVVSGYEHINRIAQVETGSMDKPVEPVIMASVTVDMRDYVFTEPVINE